MDTLLTLLPFILYIAFVYAAIYLCGEFWDYIVPDAEDNAEDASDALRSKNDE
jgi:hypothetical protein